MSHFTGWVDGGDLTGRAAFVRHPLNARVTGAQEDPPVTPPRSAHGPERQLAEIDDEASLDGDLAQVV